MPIFATQDLNDFVRDLFVAQGASASSAQCVSDILVRAQGAGHPSHGVLRVIQYTNEIREGRLTPNAQPEVVRETGVTALIDGKHAFGQVVATRALEVGLEKVREHGLAAVGTTRSLHVGRLGDYAEQAARQGFIALMWGSGMMPPGRVAPFGGRKGALGTNPVAAAVPRDEEGPQIVVDFAAAAIAEGKIRVARARGERLPPGVAIDADGDECTDPERFYQGGHILVFGGHKGYGISIMCEMLAGLATGCGVPCMPGYTPANPLFLVLFDPACFRPLADFRKDVKAFCEIVKAVPPAEGVDEVLLPGEPEFRQAAQHQELVDVVAATWEALCGIAGEVGVAPPTAVN